MDMRIRILIPVKGRTGKKEPSDSCKLALNWIENSIVPTQISRYSVILLHVRRPPNKSTPTGIFSAAEQLLAPFVNRCLSLNLHYTMIVEEGVNIKRVICDKIRDINIHYLVMGISQRFFLINSFKSRFSNIRKYCLENAMCTSVCVKHGNNYEVRERAASLFFTQPPGMAPTHLVMAGETSNSSQNKTSTEPQKTNASEFLMGETSNSGAGETSIGVQNTNDRAPTTQAQEIHLEFLIGETSNSGASEPSTAVLHTTHAPEIHPEFLFGETSNSGSSETSTAIQNIKAGQEIHQQEAFKDIGVVSESLVIIPEQQEEEVQLEDGNPPPVAFQQVQPEQNNPAPGHVVFYPEFQVMFQNMFAALDEEEPEFINPFHDMFQEQ